MYILYVNTYGLLCGIRWHSWKHEKCSRLNLGKKKTWYTRWASTSCKRSHNTYYKWVSAGISSLVSGVIGPYLKLVGARFVTCWKERIFQVSFWAHIVHLFPTSESNGIWSAVFRSWKEKTARIPHSKHRICKKKIKRPSSEKCCKSPVTVTKKYYINLYYLYPISSLPKRSEGANQRTNSNKRRKIRSITLPKAL